MNIEIRYGAGGAPLWHVSADPGQNWRLKISNVGDASAAFETIDGTGEGQAPIPSDPGTYWFFLYTSAMIPAGSISYVVTSPQITPFPKPPTFPKKPDEPIPLPVDISNKGPITEVCDLIAQGSHGNFFYNYRNRYTDQQGSWGRDRQEKTAQGQRNAICQGHAPPTPKSWEEGIQNQVTAGFDALSNYFTNGLKSVTESWQKGILDLEGRLKAWIQEQIIDIFWKALTTQGRK